VQIGRTSYSDNLNPQEELRWRCLTWMSCFNILCPIGCFSFAKYYSFNHHCDNGWWRNHYIVGWITGSWNVVGNIYRPTCWAMVINHVHPVVEWGPSRCYTKPCFILCLFWHSTDQSEPSWNRLPFWLFFVGTLAYADDLVLLAPSANAVRHMLRLCDDYTTQFNVVFNASKSKCFVLLPRWRS